MLSITTLLVFFSCSDAQKPSPVADTTASTEDLSTSTLDTSDSDSGSDSETTEVDDGPPKNVLMISLDTTRRDWFARFGGPAQTPNLDALFDRSLLLANHRSCSNWTWASMLCAQASRSEITTGSLIDAGGETPFLPETVMTADKALGQLGWRTFMVSSNQYLGLGTGLTTGFDDTLERFYADAATVNDAAFSILDTLDGLADGGDERPWYLHVHYMDLHSPYTPPDEYLEALEGMYEIPYDLSNGLAFSYMVEDFPELPELLQELIIEHLQVRYTGALEYADAQLGELLARAESSGLLEDTLVVFFTDHGEQIWEHEELGHQFGLYDEENRSLASFHAPGLDPVVFEGATRHQDIWPTAFELMGLDPVADFEGTPATRRGPDEHRFGLRYLKDQTIQMVERGGVKLTYRWNGEKALYRLADDPAEQNNLYDPEDPDVLALWELLLPEVEAASALTPLLPLAAGP